MLSHPKDPGISTIASIITTNENELKIFANAIKFLPAIGIRNIKNAVFWECTYRHPGGNLNKFWREVYKLYE